MGMTSFFSEQFSAGMCILAKYERFLCWQKTEGL